MSSLRSPRVESQTQATPRLQPTALPDNQPSSQHAQSPHRTLYEEAERFYGDNFATYDWKPSARQVQHASTAPSPIVPIPFREHGRTAPTPETNRLKSPAEYTQPFADFLTENPTVFHAVDHFSTKLSKAGFIEVCIVHGESKSHD